MATSCEKLRPAVRKKLEEFVKAIEDAADAQERSGNLATDELIRVTRIATIDQFAEYLLRIAPLRARRRKKGGTRG